MSTRKHYKLLSIQYHQQHHTTLSYGQQHHQHIVMNAKDSYGVLQDKVSVVLNVVSNVMRNAKIYLMPIVYKVRFLFNLKILFFLNY